MLDPKSLVDTIELPQTKHLRDSQLRRPSSSGAGSVPVFLAPNSKLLLRHTVSHDPNVNGHVANVAFERKSIRKLFSRVPGQLWKVRCLTSYVWWAFTLPQSVSRSALGMSETSSVLSSSSLSRELTSKNHESELVSRVALV